MERRRDRHSRGERGRHRHSRGERKRHCRSQGERGRQRHSKGKRRRPRHSRFAKRRRNCFLDWLSLSTFTPCCSSGGWEDDFAGGAGFGSLSVNTSASLLSTPSLHRAPPAKPSSLRTPRTRQLTQQLNSNFNSKTSMVTILPLCSNSTQHLHFTDGYSGVSGHLSPCPVKETPATECLYRPFLSPILARPRQVDSIRTVIPMDS